MTTKYKHRVTLACPESLIPAANQLALIVGESSADVSTFKRAGYEDSVGNKFAVCSTVVTDNFLSLQTGLPAELPTHAEGADVDGAYFALDNMVVWGPSYTFSPDVLTMAVGITPQQALKEWGLAPVITEEV